MCGIPSINDGTQESTAQFMKERSDEPSHLCIRLNFAVDEIGSGQVLHLDMRNVPYNIIEAKIININIGFNLTEIKIFCKLVYKNIIQKIK